MELIQDSIPFSFNYVDVNQSTNLDVAALIYNITTGTAIFDSQVPMVATNYGQYVGTFTGVAGNTYLVIAAVYTDNTYVTPDTNYAPESNELQCVQGTVTYFVFDYTDYSQSSMLYVQASIYNMTTGSPVFVTTVDMVHVALGCYVGTFNGILGDAYQVVKTIFTDNTYTTPEPGFASGADSLQALVAGGLFITNVFQAATLSGPATSAILEANDA